MGIGIPSGCQGSSAQSGRFPLIPDMIRLDELPAVYNSLTEPREAAYYLAHGEYANPASEALRGVIGASGPAVASVLLPTNATQVWCIEKHPVTRPALIEQIKKSDDIRSIAGLKPADATEIEKAAHFRLIANTWHAYDFNKYREALIVYELKMLGIDLSKVSVEKSRFGNTILRFMWAYPGESPKERTFTYLQADLTIPRSYPKELRKVMGTGIDFYYEKSSQVCIDYADLYLPLMAGAAARFVLMGTQMTHCLSKKDEISALLGSGLENVNDVNDAYEAYFQVKGADNYDRLTPYWWRMDMWRRR